MSEKVTTNIMTLHEYTAVIMFRARELADDKSSPMIDSHFLEKYNYDPVRIAKHEVDEKLVDLIIVRNLPGGKKEEWHIRDMIRYI